MPTLLLVVTPLMAHAGVFSTLAGMFGEDRVYARSYEPQGAGTVPLLRAATHADPNPSKGGAVLEDSLGGVPYKVVEADFVATICATRRPLPRPA